MSVRWGFLGAGWIATTAMASAVHDAHGAELRSVAARDPGRAAALLPARVSPSYAALLDDPEVDAVYISLDNASHAEWAVAALEAGKHVLCEKPLARSADEAERMATAASGADRLLIEAAWCRWHPRWRRLEQLARSGSLGSLQSVDSAFTFPADLRDSFRAEPARGGGALLDVGCYQVHLWIALMGAHAPIEITATRRDLGATGVDATTRVRARSGATRMSAVASFAMPEHQFVTVTGTDVVARLDRGQPFTSWREASSLRLGERVEDFAPVDAYRLMVEAVSARIVGEDAWVVPLDESLTVARALDAIARWQAS
jgi:predicted dehydrogenase